MQTTLTPSTLPKSTKSSEARVKRRALGRWIKRALLIMSTLALAALIVVAFLPKPVLVDLGQVELGPIRATIDEDGATRVKDRYVVSAPLTGSLARIELEPGDQVKQGDVLARLVPLAPALLDQRTRAGAEAHISGALAAQKQARAQIVRAEAHREFTQKNAERQRELSRRGALPREVVDEIELAERTAVADLDSAKFASRVADYEVEMARAALGRLSRPTQAGRDEQLVVPAPVAGRVLRVLHKSEGVVQAGTALLEVGDPVALELVVDILTSDAVSVRPGAEASILEWGGDTLPARVKSVEPSAFTRLSALGVEEQRVNVVLDLVGPREAWAALGDGYRIKASILTRQKEQTVVIASSAVFRREGGWAVFRDEAGIARLTSVEIGLRTPRSIEILNGLKSGDRVVLHPSDRVRDGVRIAVR